MDRIPAGPSDLQNNFKHSLPRPYGRGYYITALRAYSAPFVTIPMVQQTGRAQPQPLKQRQTWVRRREAPPCNSPDRQVGVTVNKTIEARRADMIHAGPSDLRNNFKHSLPRPYGRGYYMTALRA